ncbi:MAG: C39 family peptidase [Lentisphaeraceae bacterium]|nr:C39 family peptidase [Lentisphaeraceae bacterium]
MKVLLILLRVSLSSLGFAAEIQELYKKPQQHLSVAPAVFLGNNPSFKWLGANKRIALSKGDSILGNEVKEALLYVSRDGQVTGLDSLLYIAETRRNGYLGYDEISSNEEFKEMYLGVVKDLNDYFQVRGRVSKSKGIANELIYEFPISKLWDVKLEIACDRKPFKSYYLNLSVRSKGPQGRLRAEAASRLVSENANGDVIIQSIPMLDDDSMSFSEMLLLTRVALHFDLDVHKYKMVRLLKYINYSPLRGVSSVNRGQVINRYKRGLVKLHLNYEEIKSSKIKFRFAQMTSTTSSIETIGDDIDDRDKDVKYFRKALIKQIDKGKFLVCIVNLGVATLGDASARYKEGKHMRLLIGYNKEKDYVFYTDPWGKGHEVKFMKMKHAYMSTIKAFKLGVR